MNFPEASSAEPLAPLIISPDLRASFRSISAWGKFLGIVGVIMSGIIVLMAIFMMIAMPMVGTFNQVMPGASGVLFGFIYLAMAALYLIPSILLIQFGVKVQRALAIGDQLMLENGVRHLKTCFAFAGVMTIIVIGLYILFFLGAMIGAVL